MPIDATAAFLPVRIAILTISDTRTLAEDRSGDTLVARLIGAGHLLADRAIVTDDVATIVARLHGWIDDPEVDCVITTGGTGVTGRDLTPAAIERVQDKPIQSRACACVTRGTYIFALPGSTGAVKDAWDGILRDQLDSRHKPCNFVELMPRLMER